MNISQYNQALNQAMPWTAKLADIDVEELEATSEDLQCKADDKRDELREDGIETNTEYDTIKNEDNKGSAIL